ncbi:response regulator, partial [Kaarinaea lacus]
LSEDGTPVLILDVDDLVRSIDAMVNGAVMGALKPYTNVLSHKVRKRILVVDDSLTVREIERQLLEAQGYRVDVAVDGMDGWNAVRRNKYHLVVTDVDMPRMDGIELVDSMKKDNHLRSLPIMIVSYKDRHEDRQRGLEAGADYYLAKGSFHDETLIEAVVDLIGEATE